MVGGSYVKLACKKIAGVPSIGLERDAARRRRYHQRPVGDLHAERRQEESEGDGCGDGDGVGGASGEFSA